MNSIRNNFAKWAAVVNQNLSGLLLLPSVLIQMDEHVLVQAGSSRQGTSGEYQRTSGIVVLSATQISNLVKTHSRVIPHSSALNVTTMRAHG